MNAGGAAGLFPEGVLSALVPLRHGTRALLPDERRYVERAVERRQREFATGRVTARLLLQQLGMHEAPLHVGAQRQPLWPDGIVGSIAHDERFCLVCVARRGSIVSLGADVEVAEPIEDGLWGWICTPAELKAIEDLPAHERGLRVRVLFSAKESFFKCQYPLTRVMLEFGDVEVTVPSQPGEFVARLGKGAGHWPEGTALAGRWIIERDVVLTSVTCTRSDLAGVGGVD